MQPEDIIFSQLRSNESIDSVNIPRSNEFTIIPNKGKLHLRTSWPNRDVPVNGIVFFIHGYNSHFNRPAHQYAANTFTESGFAYCGVDLYGHGYSDGARGMVESSSEMVQTIVHAIRVVMDVISDKGDGAFFVDRRSSHHVHYSKLPLFLMGQSMGGALIGIVAKYLLEHDRNISVGGLIFLCPAIGLPSPPTVVRFLLDNVFAPLFPQDSMPTWMTSSLSENATWSNEDYIRYVKHDRFPDNPNGLCWGKPLRFSSASNILHISELAKDSLLDIDLPTLILHDPEDKVVPFHCSEGIIAGIKTNDEGKTLIRIEKGLHDLVSNKIGDVVKFAIQFLEKYGV